MRHRTFVIAVLVAALFGTATMSASAATTKAPVIKESFTPLPCSHDQTTVGQEGCLEKSILASDKRIDRLNAQIFKKLNARGRKDFTAGHNAWFKYRQAYCLSESDLFQGGTEAGIVDAQCTATVNTAHVKELKGFLTDLSRE